MISLKLEYNKEFVVLSKSKSNAYSISDAKDWIYLTKFSTARLITKHPRGQLETIVDRKFVYNQDFELVSNIDFKFNYILPLGNILNNSSDRDSYPNGTTQFTGNFNGNGFTMSNLNLIDSDNNGLFGSVSSSKISNLTISNVVIPNGVDNGVLAGKATNVQIENVSILGNLLISGKNSSCFIGSFEGSAKNIKICVDGIINAKIKKSIVSNIFYGSVENSTIVANLSTPVSCFSIINGRFKNSCFVSFKSVELPFYEVSKYHQIFNTYYFQLNNDELKPPQQVINSYCRNLNQIIYSSSVEDLENSKAWIKIGENFYLPNIFNYSSDIDETSSIDFYDVKSNKSNGMNYINISGNYVSDNNLETFDISRINTQCEKTKVKYEKELAINKKQNEIQIKNNRIRLSLLLNKMNQEDLDESLEMDSIEEYEDFSTSNSSDEESDLSNDTSKSINELILVETVVESAEVQVQTEQPVVESTEVQVQTDQAVVESAEVQVQTEEAVVESAEVQVQTEQPVVESAEVQVQTEEAVVESAEVQVQTEEAVVESAEVQVQTEEAVVESAKVQVQTDQAVVESAEVQVQTEEAVVESTEVQVQTDQPDLQIPTILAQINISQEQSSPTSSPKSLVKNLIEQIETKKSPASSPKKLKNQLLKKPVQQIETIELSEQLVQLEPPNSFTQVTQPSPDTKKKEKTPKKNIKLDKKEPDIPKDTQEEKKNEKKSPKNELFNNAQFLKQKQINSSDEEDECDINHRRTHKFH